ncbi:MAG: CBS domain-containing protein [Candidatus Aenigmarchaeota archaeon]|nr:CBS domain-containing protein [Candidatus Aenigmarchaeota archaeon]MDW8149778.1 CBS domain-containing protein [Candidatus Aenigmarchaeota archaeon]
MKVEDLTSKNIFSIDVDSNLTDALKLMEKKRVSRVLVRDGKKFIGILTMRDVCKRLCDYFERKLPSTKIKISSCYSKNLITINGNEDVKKAAELMLENKISSLIVVDSNNNIIGIITKTDLIKALSNDQRKVKDFATKKVITVEPSNSLLHAKELMIKNNIKRLPVLKEEKVVGIITERDISIAMYNFRKMVESKKMDKRMKFLKVEDFMSRDVITVNTNDTLGTVVEKMLKNDISGMPVLEDGKVFGIITKTDLIKALL